MNVLCAVRHMSSVKYACCSNTCRPIRDGTWLWSLDFYRALIPTGYVLLATHYFARAYCTVHA